MENNEKIGLGFAGFIIVSVILWGIFSNKPNVENIIERLPKHPYKRYSKRDMPALNTIVVHHSAVPSHQKNANPFAYANYHVGNRDWPGIGYHFVIQPSGVIYQTNEIETKSYHVGNMNNQSIGVCLSGDFTKEALSAAQKQALIKLLKYLVKKYRLAIRKHSDFSSTACPGKIHYEEIKRLASSFFNR